MTNKTRLALATSAMSMMLAGCMTAGPYNDPYGAGPYAGAPVEQQTGNPYENDRTRRGALIGAAVGAVAGLLSGDDAVERRQRALVGAGVGGLAGGAIGNYQDRQERELRDRLAGSGVDVVRQGDNITLNMPGAITFGFNQDTLQPQFYPVLDELAGTLRQYDKTIIEVAGHTDSIGSDQFNYDLSRRRAAAVANYLQSRGVDLRRVEIVAAGEAHPVASNDTDAGRALNRRVEITLVPLRAAT